MWSPRCTLKFKVRPRTSLKNILLCPVGRQSENLAIRHLVKHQLHQFFGVIVSGLSSLGNPDQHLDLVWVNLDQPNALNGLWVGEHRDQLAPHLTGERLTISGIVPRIILRRITTATMKTVWRKCSSPVHQASFSSLFFAQLTSNCLWDQLQPGGEHLLPWARHWKPESPNQAPATQSEFFFASDVFKDNDHDVFHLVNLQDKALVHASDEPETPWSAAF